MTTAMLCNMHTSAPASEGRKHARMPYGWRACVTTRTTTVRHSLALRGGGCAIIMCFFFLGSRVLRMLIFDIRGALACRRSLHRLQLYVEGARQFFVSLDLGHIDHEWYLRQRRRINSVHMSDVWEGYFRGYSNLRMLEPHVCLRWFLDTSDREEQGEGPLIIWHMAQPAIED